MKKKAEHTTIRNGNLFCLNCGESQALGLPLRIEMAAAMMKTFHKIHAKCEKTWTEPVADQKESINTRAHWWMANGETGSSSKTMWFHFMKVPQREINHPYDPDDFKRCYKLLQAIPEWKLRIPELKELNPVWSNLADNWDKLTTMFEVKDEGMYEFMKTLIQHQP